VLSSSASPAGWPPGPAEEALCPWWDVGWRRWWPCLAWSWSAAGGVGGGGEEPQTGQSEGTVSGTLSTFGFSLPDEIATTAQIDMGQYRPAAVQQVTVDGKVYGIPEFYSVRVMMINNQAVSEAGSARPPSTPPTGRSCRTWPSS
jgi:hypothetical protein